LIDSFDYFDFTQYKFAPFDKLRTGRTGIDYCSLMIDNTVARSSKANFSFGRVIKRTSRKGYGNGDVYSFGEFDGEGDSCI
jgi:hypothetical protein